MPQTSSNPQLSASPITVPAQSSPALGSVALVGAGPGDPDLITLRGADLLRSADVIVYDHLANPRLLDHAPKARHIYVGKQSAAHAMSQDAINALLIAEAQQGNRVVRLKGGDPFVFGRGGEECQALSSASIPFEVVPGITAAIAAAACAGIPVTHRDFNSSFTVITGHEADRADPAAPDLDWSALARLPALAFYMGAAALPRICARLIEHGMSADTAAATIQWGTLPRQRTVVATLRDLPQRVAEASLGPPAVTIVGRVVTLRPTLNWFERRPLFGKTIVVTRTRHQASDLSRRLIDFGAEVIEAPAIELIESPDPAATFDPALRALADGRSDWVVFTSVNAVAAVRARLAAIGLDARAFANCKLAAIGRTTAEAIQAQFFLRTDLCPDNFVAEALADALISAGVVASHRFTLLHADIARPVLVDRLKNAGAAEVTDVAVYQSRRPKALPAAVLEALEQKRIHWLTFASASAARNFAALLGPSSIAQLAGIRIASIGPITSAAIRELGLPVTIESQPSTIPALTAAIAAAESALCSIIENAL